MRAAIDCARKAGRKVAFTLSDGFVIDRFRDDFMALIDQGLIDILFSNEAEISALAGHDDFEAAVAAIAPKVPVLVSTRSEKGAIAVVGGARFAAAAVPVADVIDTTGAGDLFAAGFLYGYTQGRSLEDCGHLGCLAAGIVIQQQAQQQGHHRLALRGECTQLI